MEFRRAIVLGALISVVAASPARADLTGFIGANTSPTSRTTLGGAIGINVLMLGFEVEYASTSDDLTAGAPSLKTGMANVLLQTPVPLGGFQPYVTVGGGIYTESLAARSDTSFGSNLGGGVKVSLAGPLAVRVDYRVFKLGSGALYSPAHRIYAGLNLKF